MTSGGTRPAVLFDVDGTLIDSNYLHVQAWYRAGVPTIGVLSGGVSRAELETAGAHEVFDDPRDLCDHLGSTAIGSLAEAVQTA